MTIIEDPVVLEIIKEVLQWRRNFSARVVLCSKSAKKNQFYYINVVCINLCSEFWTLLKEVNLKWKSPFLDSGLSLKYHGPPPYRRLWVTHPTNFLSFIAGLAGLALEGPTLYLAGLPSG